MFKLESWFWLQSNRRGPEKTIIDMRESKDEKKFHRRNRDENFENLLDEVDLQEKGFLLSPHTAQTDYWCSRSSRGGLWHGVRRVLVFTPI